MAQPSTSPKHRPTAISKTDLQTFASHAVNNTVVIVPVNTGMLYLVKNMLCSLTKTSFNTSSIVFWALDKGAQTALSREGFATYHDPSLFSVSSNENVHGSTDNYYRMMRQRPQFFIDFLSTGYDILMLDADIVFWQSPLLLVPQAGVDMAYSTDAREFYTTHNAFKDPFRRGPLVPPVCNGLFWMKSSNDTIALWSQMLSVFEAPWWRMGIYRARVFQDDQRGMDVLLNDGRARVVEPLPDGITKDMIPQDRKHKAYLKVKLLDQTEVVNGQLYMFRQDVYEENLAKIRTSGRDRISAHMNWNPEIITKDDGAKKMKIFFLDDEGKCRI